ncbi:hypothetical protein ACEPAH_8752 [Sanghuangporus vaninii]
MQSDPPGPSSHELEARLKQLRDVPVNTAGSQDRDMLPMHNALMRVGLGPNGILHWFCSQADPLTRELATFLLRLHAYKNDKVDEWRKRIVQVWRGCAACIKSMDEVKKTSRTTYFGAFSDTILTKFWMDFENYEVKSIVEGLTAADITPGSGKSLADVSVPLLYHIISKPAALADPLILRIISSEPFIPRAVDWPMEPLPSGYFLLAVHEDQDVRQWAVEHVGKAKPIPLEQFGSNHELSLHILLNRTAENVGSDAFGTLGALSSLARHINSAFPFSKSQDYIWAGLGAISQVIPVEVYEPSGLHRTIMNHLHDNASHFREVLRCMLLVTKKLSKNLWTGESADYPQIVFDSIKDNPSYIDMLLAYDVQKEQPWFLFFFLEYLRSVWDMQIFGDVIARFAAFACDELQHDRFAKKRPFVTSISMQILSAALTRANKLKSASHRIAILDVLDIHFDLIVAISFSNEYDASEWASARSQAVSLIKSVMLSDVDQLEKASLALLALDATVSSDNVRRLAQSVRRQLWWKVYVNITSKNVQGASLLLQLAARTAKLDRLSKRVASRAIWKHYDAKNMKPPQDLLEAIDTAVDSVNVSITITRDGFLDAVTKFASLNSSTVLENAILQNDLARHLFPLMLSPVEDLHVAAQTLIGQAYDVDVRTDCFRALLKATPESSFLGLHSCISDFNSYASKVVEACNVSKAFVRCMTDIIDVLGGSPHGLLKDADYIKRNVTDNFSLKDELPKLWKAMATSIAVIFRRTPKWAVYFDNKTMTEWMRDALIFARELLDHRRTFEAASLAILDKGTMTSPSKPSSIGKALVEDLQDVLLELQTWLRLTDTELLYQSFSLLKSLFECFRSVGVKPSAEALTKLSKFIEQNKSTTRSKVSSYLNQADLAELEVTVADFNEDQDEVEILSVSWKGKGKRKSTDRISSPEAEEVDEAPVHKKIKTGRSRVPDIPKAIPKSTKQTKLPFSDQSTVRKPVQKPIPGPSARRGPKFEGSYGPSSTTSASSRPSSESSESSTTSESEDSESDGPGYLVRPPKQPSPKKHVKQPFKAKRPVKRIVAEPYKERIDRPKAQLIVDPEVKRQQREAEEKRKQYEAARRAAMRLKPDISSLHFAILSWNYDHDGPTPPMQLSALSHVPDTFRNHDEYLRIFRPLLMLEAWAQIVKSKEEPPNEILQVEIVSRSLQYPWLDLDTLLKAESSSPDLRLTPETDIVLLRHISEKRCIMAKVTNFRRGNYGWEISLRCCTKALSEDPGLSLGSKWNAQLIFSLATLHREYAALIALEYYDMVDIILRPKLSNPVNASQQEVRQAMETYRLNEPQAKAIISAMKTDGFSLIQGPPGTGKTSTICGLVGAFMSSRRSAPVRIQIPGTSTKPIQNEPAQKLLICAPSNAAIDEVTKRLIEGVYGSDGQRLTPKVVRVGAESQINASTKEVSLDTLVDARMSAEIGTAGEDNTSRVKSLQEEIEALRAARQRKLEEIKATLNNTSRSLALENEVNTINNKRIVLSQQLDRLRDEMKSQSRSNDAIRRKYRQQILADADVICSTLSGAGHEQLASFDFSMVIIDEASQSIELSSLIPLKYQCIRCVMVGDPQQLPPTVLSLEASKWGYNQSLFVRLQKHRPEAVHLLSIQYRMHPEISLLPSRIFYGGRLTDGPDMDKKTVQPWHADPRFGPYRFYNVEHGREEMSNKGHSLLNRDEARMVLALYNGLLRQFPSINFDYRVGIVCMYRAQAQELRNLFKRTYGPQILKTVDFNTVDGFQGQEKDIIILSCVRAGPSLSNVGFLSDIRRMNVAITRSKSSLFIFGHAPTLERSDRVWKDIVDDARSRSCFVELRDALFFSVNSVSLLQASNLSQVPKKSKEKNLLQRTVGAAPTETKTPEPSQDEPKLYSPKAVKSTSAHRKLPKGVKVVAHQRAANASSTQSNAPLAGQSSASKLQQEIDSQRRNGTSEKNGITPVPPAVLNQRASTPQNRSSIPNGKDAVAASAQKEYEAFMKRKKQSSNPFIKH